MSILMTHNGRIRLQTCFAEMRATVIADRMHVVIVEKLDRLTCDLMVQEATIADVIRPGLTLISVGEPDLMANPTRILVRQMLGAVAQYDKTQIVLKLRLRVSASTCKTVVARVGSSFEQLGEPELLERIRALRAHGMNFTASPQHLTLKAYRRAR